MGFAKDIGMDVESGNSYAKELGLVQKEGHKAVCEICGDFVAQKNAQGHHICTVCKADNQHPRISRY